MEHYTALRYTFTSESRYGSGSKCGMLGDLVVQHVGGEHHQPAQEPLLALSLRSGHGRGVGGAHQEEDTCQQIKFIHRTFFLSILEILYWNRDARAKAGEVSRYLI